MRNPAFAALFALLPCAAFAQVATTTTIASTPSPVYQGQTETTTVTVKANSGSATPTGQVQIYANGSVVASPMLSNGVATLTTNTATINTGSYSVYAVYPGATGFSKSQSTALSVAVDAPRATVTQVWVSPTNIPQGGTGYLTARVARQSGGTPPAGTVTFYGAGQKLGSAALNSGAATLSAGTARIPLGQYTVTATYSGGNGDAGSTSAGVTASVIPVADVLTFGYNAQRTNVQPGETVLTPSNVNTTSFGKITTYPVDGYIYAQPLYVSNYKMSDGQLHNVVFVATVNGTLYAFDADGKNPSAGYLWKTSLAPSGERAVAIADYGCSNPNPQSGILGTPVIDRNLGVIYAVANTVTSSGTANYYLRLHALTLSSGAETRGGPTVVQATVAGAGGVIGATSVSINSLRSAHRAALLEASGQIFIALASHCDIQPYHGWLLGYAADDIAIQTAVSNNTPNGTEGGMWMSAGGPSTDNLGNIYVGSGNGTFDANTGGNDYGEAISRMQFTQSFDGAAAQFSQTDWFVPDNQAMLTAQDLDNGMVSPLLFNDPTGSAPNLVLNADKTGVIYVMNRDDMGKYDTGTHGAGGLNGDVQEWTTSGNIFSQFAFYDNTLYSSSGNGPMNAYAFTPGSSGAPGSFNTTPTSVSTPTAIGGSYTFQPVIAANGTANAVLWVASSSTGNDTLYAFDPKNLATMFYSSQQAANNRDLGPAGVKFTVPLVADGHVFLGGQSSLYVYGLLPQ